MAVRATSRARRQAGGQQPVSRRRGGLSCLEIEAAKDVYGSVFDWQGQTWPPAQGSTYTEFLLPGLDQPVAGMVQTNELRPEDPPPHWMVYFAVTDTDQIADRIDKLGGTVSVVPFDRADVGRIAMLKDPEGAAFAVLQRG